MTYDTLDIHVSCQVDDLSCLPTNTKVPGVKTISQYPTKPPQPNSSRQHRQHSLVQRFSFRSSTFRSVVEMTGLPLEASIKVRIT